MPISRVLSPTVREHCRKALDSLHCDPSKTLRQFGEASPWWVETSGLGSGSLVYSGGVGKDISFEKELCRVLGCTIFLFDPSPTGIHTMSQPENRLEGIHFFPLGLAGSCQRVAFEPPRDADEGSFTLPDKTVMDGGDTTIAFECRSIPALMEEHGHHAIDLLKLDIEGFEYEVLESVLQSGIPVRQVCVEFHDFLPHIPAAVTRRMMRLLKSGGYRLVHRARHDHTFVRER